MTGLASCAIISFIGAVIPYLVPKTRSPDFVAWLGLATFFGVNGAVVWSQDALVRYQLLGSPMNTRLALEFVDPMATPFAMVFLSLILGWKLWT